VRAVHWGRRVPLSTPSERVVVLLGRRFRERVRQVVLLPSVTELDTVYP